VILEMVTLAKTSSKEITLNDVIKHVRGISLPQTHIRIMSMHIKFEKKAWQTGET
jgi:hypothetical protein